MRLTTSTTLTNPRPALLVVPALVAALGLWALAVGAGTSTATDPFDHGNHQVAIDPCALVRLEEARFALGGLGEPLEAPGMHIVEGQRACWYPGAGTEQPGLVVGVLDVWPDPYLESFESIFGEDLVRVEGIADDARWLARSRLVLVGRGDVLLTVQVLHPGGDREVARVQALALATLAAERLEAGRAPAQATAAAASLADRGHAA